MTREGLAWLITWGGGFLSGAVVAAIACGKVRMVSRALDRLLDDPPPVPCERSIPLPRDHELWMN